jgi:hypothetical protein
MNIYIQIEKKVTKYLRRQVWQIVYKHQPPFPEGKEVHASTEKYANRSFVTERAIEMGKEHNFLVKDYDGSILHKPHIAARPSKVITEHAIQVLVTALKEDPEYMRSWIDNISVCFQDALRDHLRNAGKRYKNMNGNDVRESANNGARNFLILLMKE